MAGHAVQGFEIRHGRAHAAWLLSLKRGSSTVGCSTVQYLSFFPLCCLFWMLRRTTCRILLINQNNASESASAERASAETGSEKGKRKGVGCIEMPLVIKLTK